MVQIEAQDQRNVTIEHDLTSMPSIELELLRRCVLQNLSAPWPKPVSAQTRELQQLHRSQYYRAIDADPDRMQDFMYKSNCPPAGFTVEPVTRPCCNVRICPWCFTRIRLVSIYQTLMTPPAQIRNLHMLVVWRRVLPSELDRERRLAVVKNPKYSRPFDSWLPDLCTKAASSQEPLPFLNGPRIWCKSPVAVQTVVPMVDPATSKIKLVHVGLQLVPKQVDAKAILERKVDDPPLNILEFEKVDSRNVIEAMWKTLTFPWRDLFQEKHLEQFMAIRYGFYQRHLVWTDRYRHQSNKTRK